MLFTKEVVPWRLSAIDGYCQNPVYRVMELVVLAVFAAAYSVSIFYRVYSPVLKPASSSLVGVAVVSGQTVMFHPQQYRWLWAGHWLPNSRAS